MRDGSRFSHSLSSIIALVFVCCVLGTSRARAESANAPSIPSAASRHSFLHRVIWFVPNRMLDLMDVFRARVRVGPGVAVTVRMTDYGWFHFGNHAAVYAGLPGPRLGSALRSPVGFERLNGIVIAGVQATDDTIYHPGYAAGEFDIGLHVGIVGAEVGLEPGELLDLLAGWVGLDPRKDDR